MSSIGNIKDFQFECSIPSFETFKSKLDEKVKFTKSSLQSIIHSKLSALNDRVNAALLKVIENAEHNLLDVTVRFTAEDNKAFRNQLAYIHPSWEQLLCIPQNYDDMEDLQMEVTAHVFQPLIAAICAKDYHAYIERVNPRVDGLLICIRAPMPN